MKKSELATGRLDLPDEVGARVVAVRKKKVPLAQSPAANRN